MKIDSPVLRRLGPVPFWRGSVKCLEGLQGIYRKASVAASVRLGRSAQEQASPKAPKSKPFVRAEGGRF